MFQNPNSYHRLQVARTLRPFCWGRDKPHIFLFEGLWRVSLMPVNWRRRTPIEREMIRQRWLAAYNALDRLTASCRGTQ